MGVGDRFLEAVWFEQLGQGGQIWGRDGGRAVQVRGQPEQRLSDKKRQGTFGRQTVREAGICTGECG